MSQQASRVLTVTIAQGATESDPIRVGNARLFGIIFPAAMTGGTISFKVATERDGTYVGLVDENGDIEVTVDTGSAIALTGEVLEAVTAWPWVKLVSGSSEAAARTLVVSLKDQV